MTTNGANGGPTNEGFELLPHLPFIWPEARAHSGQAVYQKLPPFEDLIAGADFVSGVLVGAGDRTIQWVQDLAGRAGSCKISLVVVVHPAGPTLQEHLVSLELLAQIKAGANNPREKCRAVWEVIKGNLAADAKINNNLLSE